MLQIYPFQCKSLTIDIVLVLELSPLEGLALKYCRHHQELNELECNSLIDEIIHFFLTIEVMKYLFENPDSTKIQDSMDHRKNKSNICIDI